MGTSVCFISGKDGVGKTFITINLGFLLSRMGMRVLVLDGDLEGPNAGLSIGIDRPDKATLHDVLGKRAEVVEAVNKTEFGFHLLAGDMRVTALENIQLENYSGLLGTLEKIYDIVLVDTTSKYGPELAIPLATCGQAIIVLEPNILSISDSMKTRGVARRLETKVTGVIINKIMGESRIPAEKIAQIMESPIIGSIPHSPDVVSALDSALPLWKMNPRCPSSHALNKLATKLVGVQKTKKERKIIPFLKRNG